MLLTADRNFYSFDLWHRALATGADLLWRVNSLLTLPVIRSLPDGSYLSLLIDPKIPVAKRGPLIAAARSGKTLNAATARPARVIEYSIADSEGNGTGELICLITTILDHTDTAAIELADGYHQRWEIENTFDEIKTHQRGDKRVLRSKLPELVKQEIWALLLTHYAIRTLMTEAADEADVDPDRLSFIRTLRVIRRQVADQADFSPCAPSPRTPTDLQRDPRTPDADSTRPCLPTRRPTNPLQRLPHQTPNRNRIPLRHTTQDHPCSSRLTKRHWVKARECQSYDETRDFLELARTAQRSQHGW